MAKSGILARLGLAGLLSLGSVTTACHKNEIPTVPAQRSVGTVLLPIDYESRKKQYLELKDMKEKGLITDFDETPFLDIINAEKRINQTASNPIQNKPSLFDTPKSITTQEEPSKWSFYATPYLGMKFALRADEKPNPMPVIGAKIGIKKDRSGFYAGAEYGEMDESESSSAGYLDLKNKSTKLRLGAEYDVVQGNKLRLTASAGTTLTLERNEITGRVGTYDVDDSKKENVIGLEAEVEAEYKLNDKLSITAGAVYGHNFEDDNSNVTDDLTGKVGVKIKF